MEALGDRIDVQSRAEVIAYVTSTKASAFFDRGNWDEALDHLAVARRLLSALAKSSSDTRGEALANSFVDSTEGQMRFCAYQLGEEEQDMDKVAEKRATGPVQERVCPQFASLIEKLTAGKQSTAQKETVEIEWQGKSIPIRNAELVDAVVRVRKEEEALQQSLTSTPAGGQPAASARSKGKKPQRLTHAERTARKRSSAAQVAGGESSSAAASRALSSSRSTNDPFDHALAALTDGELLARQLVDDNAEALSKSHSARYEAVGEDLKSAHEWMSYRLSSLQIKRSARLAEEVEVKAQKRETRKQAALKKNLVGQRRSTAPSSKKSKAMPKPTKEPRKPQPGSKPKQARKVPRAGRRRPAYSGTRRQRAKAQTSRATRAQSLLEGQARRRSARSIPALVKLLDSSEANLVSISALSIVESDPDVSSVIDGKTAWYRAELLRHLARAHDLAEEKGHSCLLLRRAALSIRQARQALDLVEDASVTQQLDGDIPPALNESTLDKADALIDATLRQVQREAFFASHGKRVHAAAALSLTQTKAGQQLRSLAAKHVDFDPVDVEEALQMDPALQEECERELRQGYTAGQRKAPATSTSTTVRGTDFATATGHAEEEADGDDHFVEAEHGAVTDEEDHDDEFGDAEQKDDLDVAQAQTSGGQAQQGQEQKAGWLGGWFGRK